MGILSLSTQFRSPYSDHTSIRTFAGSLKTRKKGGARGMNGFYLRLVIVTFVEHSCDTYLFSFTGWPQILWTLATKGS